MHRGWMENSVIAGSEPFSKREAWCWLIETARFADGEEWINGGTVTVLRGQLCKAYRYLAKAWKWDESRVRRFCRTLEKANMIQCGTAAGQALVTICNYDIYQADQCGDAAVNDAAPPQHRRSTAANNKKGNKGNNINPPIPPSDEPDTSDDGDWLNRLDSVDRILVAVWMQTGATKDDCLKWLTTTKGQGRDKVAAWLKLGPSVDDIAAKITAIFDEAEHRGQPIQQAWPYLDKTIKAWAAEQKRAEQPTVTAQTPWHQRVSAFRDSGAWLPSWGPRPSEASCHVPPRILSEFGYQSESVT